MRNKFFDNILDHLRYAFAEVFFDTNEEVYSQDVILGWFTTDVQGHLIYHYNTISDVDIDICDEHQSLLVQDMIETYSYKSILCKSEKDVMKVVKRTVREQCLELLKNPENETLRVLKRDLGKYYRLYSNGTEAILIAVSATDEDYYNVFLTENSELIFSSAVGVPYELTEPSHNLKRLVERFDFRKIVETHIKNTNSNNSIPDYIFSSILD